MKYYVLLSLFTSLCCGKALAQAENEDQRASGPGTICAHNEQSTYASEQGYCLHLYENIDRDAPGEPVSISSLPGTKSSATICFDDMNSMAEWSKSGCAISIVIPEATSKHGSGEAPRPKYIFQVRGD